jgi:metallophosphoesterase (TIGR00282 family)
MKVLVVGDIYGKPGRYILSVLLPRLQEEFSVDFTIVNGENAAGGFGITENIAKKLRSYGVDCITSGNHIWDRQEISSFLDESDYLLRPANYPPTNPGKGYHVFRSEGKPPIAIINLQGRSFMKDIDCPFRIFEGIIGEIQEETGIIVVDFHAETTAEKKAFGWFVDGKVSLVFGTHTHVQTADETILPNGTGYITDVGMTGPFESVIGVKKEASIAYFLKKTPQRFDTAQNNRKLNGIIVEIDEASGKTISIERLERSVPDGDNDH